MTTFTKTVDPNGGSDYLSISLWEAGEQTLYTSGDIAIADCKRTGEAVDTTSVLVNGWTAGVLPRIVANSAHRHDGIKGAGYILRPTSSHSIRYYVPVEVDGIEIDLETASFNLFNSGGTITASNTLFYNIHGLALNGSLASTTLINCNFFDVGTEAQCGTGSVILGSVVYNCIVFVKSGDGATTGRHIRSCDVYNSMIFNVDNDTSIGVFSGNTGDYNASSDNSAQGVNNAINKTDYATYFVDHTTNDFHLNDASGTLFGLASEDLSATFTDDIDGDTRPADNTFGLGSDYFVVAGGITGTGAHQASTATHSATGERSITGSASHNAETATHSASGTVAGAITGTASHQANTATQAATGERIVTGVSSHQAATATHSGTGQREVTGSSNAQAETATHSASGLRLITGSASHTASTATHSASGAVGNVVSGTGNHSANDATHSAIGLRIVGGTASHQAQTATHSATGEIVGAITGTASHQAERATSTGVALRVITGSGAHQANTATQVASQAPLVVLPVGITGISDITQKTGIIDTTETYSILKLG